MTSGSAAKASASAIRGRPGAPLQRPGDERRVDVY